MLKKIVIALLLVLPLISLLSLDDEFQVQISPAFGYTFAELNEQKISQTDAVQKAEEERNKASEKLRLTNPENEEEVKKAQDALDAANRVVDRTKSVLGNTERSLEETPEFKMKQISDKYTQLIAGTIQKGSAIDAEISSCDNCTDKAILEQQKLANEEYIRYLEKRQWLELCQVDPECSKDEEKMRNLQTDVNNQAQAMRNILKALTDEEMKRNVERTFNVSRVFSLEENEDRGPLELRKVVDTIADWLIMLVSSLAVTTLIIGGFMMIISGGDENRLETGKTIFVYSLIGLTVTLLSFGIITFVQSLFY
jgi:hypothetical protein